MTQAPGDNQHLEKTPPQAIEIEQAVLGAMMLEQRAVVHALDILYRPDIYGIRAATGTSLERLTEIIIDKQRNGLPSSVYLRWNAFSATYESFGPE